MDRHGETLQNIVRGILQAGLVEEVLAFAQGLDESDVVPLFITEPPDAERVVAISYYPCSLAKLVAEYEDKAKKIGVVVRSCDARAMIELAKREQVNLDNIYLIGIECYGVVKSRDGFGEVYMALKTGTIDGQDNPLPTDYSEKFCEVTHYIVLTEISMNNSKF